jgi:hypothetical protein
MGLTRREFLKLVGATTIGGLAGLGIYSLLEKPSATEIIYEGNKTVTTTETVTVTKTYTSNTTVTGTSTQTTTTTTQPPQRLDKILFGGSDMQFIPLKLIDGEKDSNNAYLTLYNPLTNNQLQIALPIQYVSNGNIDIVDLLSAVKNYNQNYGTNYEVYVVLGRLGLDQAIQQNGVWYLPAPQIYYNIVISDGGWQDVYNALLNLFNGNATVVMPTSNQGPYSNSLWAWINGVGSVVIVYQSGQQVNSVVNDIYLTDSILGTSNNPNPTSGGILHVDTIANVQQVGVYNSGGNQYPVYGVNDYDITIIDFETEEGNPLFSNL